MSPHLTPIPDLSGAMLQQSRREFLASCSALGLALTGCTHLLPKTTFGRLILNSPHPDDYRPVISSIIQTILPFTHAEFPPVSPDEIEARLFTMFDIADGNEFLSLRRSLMFFDRVPLFPHEHAPIAEGNHFRDEDAAAQIRKHEERIYAAFSLDLPSEPDRFTLLGERAQLRYLTMWGQSGYTLKRQFYRSVKALVMITTYSHEGFWKAIGYKGPVLGHE